MKLTLDNYKEIVPPNQLSNMLLNATNQCNLRCTYCFTTPNPQRMPIEVAKKAILWGLEHKAPWAKKLELCWFGGEPMLEFNRLLVPVMEWCKNEDLPIEWNITTNLTLITDEVLKIFDEYGVGILSSIDGPEEMQDCCRKTANGDGSWNLIKDVVPKVANYRRAYGYRTTISPYNCDTLFNAYKHAYESGFGMWFGGPDVCGRGWTQEKLDILERELFYIGMNYFDLVFYEKEERFMLPQLERELKEVFAPSYYIKDEYEDLGLKTFQRCGLGTTSIGVSPTGQLIACQEHSTYQEKDIFFVGDIFNGIDAERHIRLLNQYAEDKERHYNAIKNSEKCRHCEIRGSCAAEGLSCTSTSYEYNKTLVTINPFYCEFTRMMHAVAKAFVLRAKMEGIELLEYAKKLFSKEVTF